MQRKENKIPVNSMDENFSKGIAIDKNSINQSDFNIVKEREQAAQSHRDEGYTFHILERGTVLIEIDFQQYQITAPAVVYLHPNQVHRILDFDNVMVRSMSIAGQNLNQAYIKILEEITPAAPLSVKAEDLEIITTSFDLSMNFYRQRTGKLDHSLLKDSCNTLTAFLLSRFLLQDKKEDNLSRFDRMERLFRKLLEENYSSVKRPGQYAAMLHISTSYLNECVKNACGLSVSELIQNRVVLEAKRLLYHTDKSVKEIAFDLGYEDYPYFTRLFRKAAGEPALAFRNKNRE